MEPTPPQPAPAPRQSIRLHVALIALAGGAGSAWGCMTGMLHTIGSSEGGTALWTVLWLAALVGINAGYRGLTSGWLSPERESARTIFLFPGALTAPFMLLLMLLAWLPHGVA